MATVYKSKIDAWLAVPLIFAIAISFCAGATILFAGGQSWVAVVVVFLGAGLPSWLLLDTRYCLESGQLHARCGPFRWCVPVAAITGITPTRSLLSSPALSLDRLRIEYGSGKAIMISPRNKDALLKEIEAMRGAAD